MQNADLYQFAFNGSTPTYANRFGITDHQPADDNVTAFLSVVIISLTGVELTAQFTRNWTAASVRFFSLVIRQRLPVLVVNNFVGARECNRIFFQPAQVELSEAPLYVLMARGNFSVFTRYHFSQRHFSLDSVSVVCV